MKDLITTISSIMIISVFVMQFCSNQVLATKILMADAVRDNIKIEAGEDNMDATGSSGFEKQKIQLASCFDCLPSDVFIIKNQDKIIFTAPMKNVVAGGEFLGIDEELNRCTYTREVLAG